MMRWRNILLLVGVLGGMQLLRAQRAETPLTVEFAAAPRYPLPAYVASVDGQVEVEVELSAAGQVVGAKAIGGPYILRDAAEEAAAYWRFQAGSGVGSRKAQLTFLFTLNKGKPKRLSAIFKSPLEVEIVGEEESTQILADPPGRISPPR